MGNICRSPTAESVLRAKIAQAGLAEYVKIASAGTHNYHPGSPADARSRAHALKRGYDLSQHRARQIQAQDFERFDWILAMDWDNLALLEEQCPEEHRHKLRLLMTYADMQALRHPSSEPIVPDPYYGGAAGFEQVLDLLEAASDGLVATLLKRWQSYRSSEIR